MKSLLFLVFFNSTMACTHLRLHHYDSEAKTVSIQVRKTAYEPEAELAAEDYCNAKGKLLKVEGRVYTYTCEAH